MLCDWSTAMWQRPKWLPSTSQRQSRFCWLATLAVETYYDVEGYPRHLDIESAGQNADECYEKGENTTCRGGFSCVCFVLSPFLLFHSFAQMLTCVRAKSRVYLYI